MLFAIYRRPTSLTLMWSWTSWDTLGCLKLWRSVGLDSPSAEPLRTSTAGRQKYQINVVHVKAELWWALGEKNTSQPHKNLSRAEIPYEQLCLPLFFFHRYTMILKDQIHSDDEKQKCSDLLTLHDSTKKDWQMGRTKVEHTCTDLFMSLRSQLSLT